MYTIQAEIPISIKYGYIEELTTQDLPPEISGMLAVYEPGEVPPGQVPTGMPLARFEVPFRFRSKGELVRLEELEDDLGTGNRAGMLFDIVVHILALQDRPRQAILQFVYVDDLFAIASSLGSTKDSHAFAKYIEEKLANGNSTWKFVQAKMRTQQLLNESSGSATMSVAYSAPHLANLYTVSTCLY